MTGAWSTTLVPEQYSRNAAHSDMHSRQPHGKKTTRLVWLDWTKLFPTYQDQDRAHLSLLIVCCSWGCRCSPQLWALLLFLTYFYPEILLNIHAASEQQCPALYWFSYTHGQYRACTVQTTTGSSLMPYCKWMKSSIKEHSCSCQLVSKPPPDVAVIHLPLLAHCAWERPKQARVQLVNNSVWWPAWSFSPTQI